MFVEGNIKFKESNTFALLTMLWDKINTEQNYDNDKVTNTIRQSQ